MKKFKTIVTFKNGNTGVRLVGANIIYFAETGMSPKDITMTIDEYSKYSEYIEKMADKPSEAKKIANYRKQIETIMNLTNQILSGGIRIVKL